MAQIYKKLEIDVYNAITPIATAVQNDSNSRFLDVVLLNGSTPIDLTGHEVRIYCKKPEEGGEVFNDGVITEPINGRCQFPLTDQTLSKVGYVEAQIVMYYNNVQILQTVPFKINVVKSLISNNAISSSNEYGALVILFQNIYEAHALMTTMVQNQGEKGAISTDRNINTFWESMEYVSKYLDTDLTNLLNTVLAEANVQGVIDRLGNTADTGATDATGTVMGKSNEILRRSQKGFISPLLKTEIEIVAGKLTVDVRFDGKKRVRKLLIGHGTSSEVSVNLDIDGTTIQIVSNQNIQYISDSMFPVCSVPSSGTIMACTVFAGDKNLEGVGYVPYEFDVENYFTVQFITPNYSSPTNNFVTVLYEERG